MERAGGREAELYGGGGEEKQRGEVQGHRVVKVGERRATDAPGCWNHCLMMCGRNQDKPASILVVTK